MNDGGGMGCAKCKTWSLYLCVCVYTLIHMIRHWNENEEFIFFFLQTRVFAFNVCERICVPLEQRRERESARAIFSFTRSHTHTATHSVFHSHFTFSSFLFDDYCLHLFVVTFTYVHILYTECVCRRHLCQS